jgi:hypothetical protein
MLTVPASVCNCRNVASAEASSSCDGAVTARSSPKRFSIRSMKKLPPRNVCRPSRSRGSPTTEAIGVACASGMWQDWQLPECVTLPREAVSIVAVTTASSSGYAFSVTSGRGRFSSPRGLKTGAGVTGEMLSFDGSAAARINTANGRGPEWPAKRQRVPRGPPWRQTRQRLPEALVPPAEFSAPACEIPASFCRGPPQSRSLPILWPKAVGTTVALSGERPTMLPATTLLVVLTLMGAPVASLACDLWCTSPAAQHHRLVGCHRESVDPVWRQSITADGAGCHAAILVALFPNEVRSQASAPRIAAVPVPVVFVSTSNRNQTPAGAQVFVLPAPCTTLPAVLRI